MLTLLTAAALQLGTAQPSGPVEPPDAAASTEAPGASRARPAHPWRISAGYYGDVVTHPGGVFGFSWRAAQAGRFSASLGLDLGAYHHRRNHTGAFLRGSFASRFTTTPGFFVEPRFTLGYLHTWVSGDGTFAVDDRTGLVREVRDTGTPNVSYGIGLGLGWELQKGPAAGLGMFVRPEVLARAPYAGHALGLTQFAVAIGVQWRFGGRG